MIKRRRLAFEDFLTNQDGLVYIPALAAAEFLLGAHPPVRADLVERARRIYENLFKDIVTPFNEADATQLALLNSQMRGQQIGFYNACIAEMVLSRGDIFATPDRDYDRISGLNLRKIWNNFAWTSPPESWLTAKNSPNVKSGAGVGQGEVWEFPLRTVPRNWPVPNFFTTKTRSHKAL